MKKLLISMMAGLALTACQSYEADSPMPDDETLTELQLIGSAETYSKMRTAQDAVDIANSVMSRINGQARSSRIITASEAIVIRSKIKSRSDADTLMYAVNFGDNEGFVLVSAPTLVEPIIALTEQGDFNAATTQDNSAFQSALTMAENYIVSKVKPVDPIGPIEPIDTGAFPLIKKEYTTKTKYDMKTRNLDIAWGQGWPENIYAPNSIAGCVPVAIAQIMCYFQCPSQIKYTFSTAPIPNEELHWENISLHKKVELSYNADSYLKEHHYSECDADKYVHETIGRIVREIGQRANARYRTDGTGTGVSSGDDINTLKNMLNGSLDYYTIEGSSAYELCESFYQNKGNGIAYARGRDPEDDSGHAWVADGAWLNGYITKHYVLVDSKNGIYMMDWWKAELARYLHFNWGYNGNSDGYFLVDIFDSKKGSEYDNPSIYPNDFNYENQFYYCLINKRN